MSGGFEGIGYEHFTLSLRLPNMWYEHVMYPCDSISFAMQDLFFFCHLWLDSIPTITHPRNQSSESINYITKICLSVLCPRVASRVDDLLGERTSF